MIAGGLPVFSSVLSANLERITSVYVSPSATTVSAVLDPELDLATRVARERPSVPSPVPLGPLIVVGQGAHESNLTFVRVLNENGISTAQFLAYPVDVKGGVRVAAGRDAQGEGFIVTAPIAATDISGLRIYDLWGGLRGELLMPPALRAPFVVAVGEFSDNHPGDEIAVASAVQDKGGASGMVLYDEAGGYLEAIRFTSPAAGSVSLESYVLKGRSHLELFYQASGTLLQFDPEGGAHAFKQFLVEEQSSGLYRSAFGQETYLLALDDEGLSEVIEMNPQGEQKRVNIGRHENEFWITADKLGLSDDDAGEYIKFARYGHVRTDGSSPAYKDSSIFESELASDWERGTRPAATGLGQLMKSLDQLQRVLWEPCFTHRQFNERFEEWKQIVDEATGLPKYLTLSRLNNISYYGEFGETNSFVGSTYAPGLPALDRLYLLPLRAFLMRLSESFREHPERVISVEPNHEHEIGVKEDKSVGDYNPAMIRGFREYLKSLYGENLEQVLVARKGPPLEEFDAPRDTNRGGWDAYATDNPFFNDWVYYNRYVVNRRIADTLTQALLAGFPSEILRTHQIPDRYAIGTLDLFSERMVRITPIDYAMTAGTGFGFTRFTVWFNKPHNAFKAGFTSGFDSITFGEYQALTADQDLANEQLIHVWKKGGNAIHAMNWPASHDRGFNQTMKGAIEHLLENYDKPRTVVTGGISKIKAYESDGNSFNVAAIGQGDSKRGLLKSLRADGSWEGSVYAVPFRTVISARDLQVTDARNFEGARVLETEPISGIEGGEQFVVQFQGSSARGGEIRFRVRHLDGGYLPGYDQIIKATASSRAYRFVLRSQMPADGLILSMEIPNDFQPRDLSAQRQTEEVARPHRDDHEGIPHQGGLSFDLL
jgi:hypothetical protein